MHDYIILYRMIQDFIGLYRTIQDYTGLYRTLQDYTRLYRTIQDHTGVHSLPEAPHQNGGQTHRHTHTHTHTQNLWNLEVLTHLKNQQIKFHICLGLITKQ